MSRDVQLYEDERRRRMIDMARAQGPLGVGGPWGDPPWAAALLLAGGIILAILIVVFIGWWR